jgi:cell division protein FtsI (penicillin-binding protein 3)
VIVVVNPQTGDLLALTNRPTFDPNRYGESPVDSRRNLCLTDPQEPGSTFKPFVAGAVLDEGFITTDAKIFCENGLFRVGKRLVHDTHPYGTLSFTEVIAKSSNIGAAKLGLMLGIDKLHSYVRGFGFGEMTGLELPGEAAGIVRPRPLWRTSSTVVSVSFGHEIAVTPVQLARAFCVFANGGYLPSLKLVRSVGGKPAPDVWGDRPARPVLSGGTVAKMKAILAEVTISGTGKKARLEGYGVAGKTGTAQKRNPDGRYCHDRFCSYFIGFGPVEKPNVLVMVMIDEPQGAYYGGTVAAPVVGKIIERSLKYLEIPPAGSGTKEQE